MRKTCKFITFLFIISVIFNINTIYQTLSASKENAQLTKGTYEGILSNLYTISISLDNIQLSKDTIETEEYFHSTFHGISSLQVNLKKFDMLTRLNYNTTMSPFYTLSLDLYILADQPYIKYIKTKEIDNNKIKSLQREVDILYTELKKIEINNKEDLEKISTIIRNSNIKFN